MEFILKVLAVLSLSFIKYLAGVAVAYATLSPTEGFIAVLIGSNLAVLFFTFGGSAWLEFLKKKRKNKSRKVFSKWNRFLVKLKRNGGLPAIAIISPILISIPLGCLISLTFIHNKNKIAVYMICSVFVWCVIFFGFKSILPQILALVDR